MNQKTILTVAALLLLGALLPFAFATEDKDETRPSIRHSFSGHKNHGHGNHGGAYHNQPQVYHHPQPYHPVVTYHHYTTTPKTCTYWCKDSYQRFICCDDNPYGFKAGTCPPKRPVCPHYAKSSFAGPKVCSNDYNCSGYDKCCDDACLGFVCKPPMQKW